MWMEKIEGDNAPPPPTPSSTVDELERVLVLVKELGVVAEASEPLVGEISAIVMRAIAELRAAEEEEEEEEKLGLMMAPVGSPSCSIVGKNEINCTSEQKKKKKKKNCRTLGTEEKKSVHRRRSQPYTSTRTISSLEDGYTWRKYGQKIIHSSKHPRSYYRCTHKEKKGCQATRQAQKSDEGDNTYHVKYIGHHTCRNEHQASGGTGCYTDLGQARLISFGSPPPLEAPAPAAAPPPPAASTAKKEWVEQDVVSELTHEYQALSELTPPPANSSIPILSDVLTELGDVTSGLVYADNLMEGAFDFTEMFESGPATHELIPKL